jgi:ABC-type nickel/cobalt efflux system permease component RcnA
MTLAAGERRALAKIEKSLRGSDPKLVARLSTFNRLTQAEEMPQRESLAAPSRLRRRSAGAGFWSGRNRRTPPGQPSTSHHFGTSRLPSQGHYPHTMRLSSSARRPGRSRIAAILSVAMAACALGLMVILFSVLNHVRPAGATPAPATTCHYVMMTGCQSAQITAHKR